MARIDGVFEAFLAERRAQGLRPATEQLYRDAWAALRALPGSGRPSTDTVRQLARLPALPAPVGGAAVQPVRVLRPVLAFLQAQGALPRRAVLPAFQLRRVTGPPALTESEVVAVLRAVSDPGVQMLGLLVYLTGLRSRRLINLPPSAADLDARTLTVEVDGVPVRLSLSTDAVEACAHWARSRPLQATRFLHDASGQPLTPAGAFRALRIAGAATGRPTVGFGTLQYAHVRLLARTFPFFNQDLLETRLLQPFRLRCLQIPLLFHPDSLPQASTHLERLLQGAP